MNTVLSIALALAPPLALAPIPASAPAPLGTLAEDRPADVIRAELEALTLPEYDEERMMVEGYGDSWRAACESVRAQRAPLIQELWKAHPEEDGLGELLAERWEHLLRLDDELVYRETEDILNLGGSEGEEGASYAPPESVLEWAVHYSTAAAISIHGPERDGKAIKAAIDRLIFMGVGSSDMRSDLMHCLLEFVPDYSLHGPLYKRLSQGASKEVAAQGDRMATAANSVDAQFGWSFDNALKKGRYNFAKQKGKVLVVEFWKVGQRESLERIPMLKRLRETYPELELVGVSMNDRSELKRSEFREVCAELGIDWAQYFQGDGIESFYSNGWGVFRSPRTFVVGTDGRVRKLWVGSDLEEIVKGLHP